MTILSDILYIYDGISPATPTDSGGWFTLSTKPYPERLPICESALASHMGVAGTRSLVGRQLGAGLLGSILGAGRTDFSEGCGGAGRSPRLLPT